MRQTNTDGTGYPSCALYFKVHAVASDGCPRAEGQSCLRPVILMISQQKVKDVLDNYEEHKRRLEMVTLEDNAENYKGSTKDLTED